MDQIRSRMEFVFRRRRCLSDWRRKDAIVEAIVSFRRTVLFVDCYFARRLWGGSASFGKNGARFQEQIWRHIGIKELSKCSQSDEHTSSACS